MSKVILHNCIKTRTGLTKENYIWSETHFLEKRKTSYVGSYSETNVSLSVGRPKPVNKADPNATIPAVQF